MDKIKNLLNTYKTGHPQWCPAQKNNTKEVVFWHNGKWWEWQICKKKCGQNKKTGQYFPSQRDHWICDCPEIVKVELMITMAKDVVNHDGESLLHQAVNGIINHDWVLQIMEAWWSKWLIVSTSMLHLSL